MLSTKFICIQNPQLVTLEMINKCKEIAKDNITKPKKQYDSYYFGKGLLRCPYCGGIMVAKKNNNTYHCQICTKGFWIQINLVDNNIVFCFHHFCALV